MNASLRVAISILFFFTFFVIDELWYSLYYQHYMQKETHTHSKVSWEKKKKKCNIIDLLVNRRTMTCLLISIRIICNAHTHIYTCRLLLLSVVIVHIPKWHKYTRKKKSELHVESRMNANVQAFKWTTVNKQSKADVCNGENTHRATIALKYLMDSTKKSPYKTGHQFSVYIVHIFPDWVA